MPRKNGKTKNETLHVTIKGVSRVVTLEELKAEDRPLTARNLERMRRLGKGLFRTDKEFEEFQDWLRESRKGG